MKLKILTSILIIIFSANLEAKNYDIERIKYTKALKYFKNKNYQKFIDLKEQLKEYPLYADLEYKNLHKFHLKNDKKKQDLWINLISNPTTGKMKFNPVLTNQ